MYHIGTGWAGIIYAGTVRKDKKGREVWTKKSDCTSEFYAVLLGLLMQNGNELHLNENGKEKYVVRLEVKEEDEGKKKPETKENV